MKEIKYIKDTEKLNSSYEVIRKSKLYYNGLCCLSECKYSGEHYVCIFGDNTYKEFPGKCMEMYKHYLYYLHEGDVCYYDLKNDVKGKICATAYSIVVYKNYLCVLKSGSTIEFFKRNVFIKSIKFDITDLRVIYLNEGKIAVTTDPRVTSYRWLEKHETLLFNLASRGTGCLQHYIIEEHIVLMIMWVLKECGLHKDLINVITAMCL